MSTEAASFASFLNIFAGVFFAAVAIFAAVMLLLIVSLWKIFTKAGREGWESIVPIYNVYIMILLARLPGWMVILCFIPFVNIFFSVYIIYKFSLAFGKGVGYTLGMIFLPFIFYPMLAFGDSAYQENSTFSSEDVPVTPAESVSVENSAPVESSAVAAVAQVPTTVTQTQ